MKGLGQLLTGTSLMLTAGLAASGSAAAQQTAPAPQDQSAGQPPAASAPQDSTQPADAAADAASSGDIVVTALRRETTLQRTPVAISVLGAGDIQRTGAASPDALNKLVPGVEISPAGGPQASIFVRGIGSLNANAYGDPAVAYSIDGVYVARPTGPAGTIFDLERIEVLKGPQGTLYGRNATGGAINVITAKPDLTRSGGEVGLEIGNYDQRRLNGMVNLALSPTLAFRAAGQITRHDGYLTDGRDDAKTDAARAHLLFEPGDEFRLLVSGDYAHDGGFGPGDIPLTSTGGFFDPDHPRRAPQPGDPLTVPACRVAPYCQQRDSFIDNTNWTVYATADVRLPFATLTFSPAHRVTEARYLAYNQAFRQEVDQTSHQNTAELRLASTGDGRLDWVVGAFYLNERQTAFQRYTQVAGPLDVILDPITDESVAGFGQATFALLPTLRLTGGLRYTWEKKTQAGTSVISGVAPAACPTPLVGGRCAVPNSGSDTFDAVTWRAGVEADVAPRHLVYANVSTGFKAGGFFNGLPPNNYDPERITAYALGTKNQFFGSRLTLNLEAFYYKYTDLQVSLFGLLNPAGLALITQNAASARLYGVELDTRIDLSRHDRLNANVLYNNAKYDDFQVPNFSPDPTDPRCTRPTTFCLQRAANYAGNQIPRAPFWSGQAGYTHVFDLADTSQLEFGIRGRFESAANLATDPTIVGQDRDGYANLDADLTYRVPGGSWSITAYVSNITDETYGFRASRSSVNGATYLPLNPPRLYGMRINGKF